MTRLATLLLAATLAPLVAVPVAGQARRAQEKDRCLIQLVRADRQGVRTSPAPGIENYYTGGNVHVRCVGRNIHIYADSMASFDGVVIQFISQGSRVRYRDSTTELDTDFGTYFRDGERFEAQGNSVHRDTKSGSTIRGPRIDYFRPLEGQREQLEVVAYNRPTLDYVVTDSLGRPQAPYRIVGNTVRTRGSTELYAGGAVTVDREDLKASADSLWLDTGERQGGRLIGRAALKSGSDSALTLTGRSIDLGLTKKELTRLKARDSALLVSRDVTMRADSIQIELVDQKADRIVARGKTVRPDAVSADYRVLGDSIVVETPGEKLSRVLAYENGWAGLTRDTAAASERDWIAGGKVTISFTERDSAGVKKTVVSQLEAEREAQSFYRQAPDSGQALGSINYTRAKKIVVTMQQGPNLNRVDRVTAEGEVDGIHLQPGTARRRDSIPPIRVPPGAVARPARREEHR